MSQTRLGSIVETVTNTAVGYGINFAANLTVLPMFGYHVKIGDNVIIGVIYTVISVVRSYVIRRVYNQFGGFR